MAEVPIQGLNPVKPNIMLTMDDSGSMGMEHLPDYISFPGSGIYHCRDGATTSLHCGGNANSNGNQGSSWLPSLYDPPFRSANYNAAFYDPTSVYTPGKKADGTNLPCQGSDTTCVAPWTSLYTNGFTGYPGANSSGTINLTTGYPDTVWCWSDLATLTSAQKTAALATADLVTGNGSVCRRNGPKYTTGGSFTVSGLGTFTVDTITTTGYNYPNSLVATTGVATTCSTGSAKCKFIYPFTVNGTPYYYTISQVQYCSAKNAAGWGTTPCVSDWDPTTYKYVRYGTGAATFDPQAFTRVDIRSTGFLVNGVSAANPSGRTYAQEMQNFAIWYSFYRTRMQMMKSASGIAFSALDQNSRVGYHTLAENATLFTNIKDFTTANKQTWFTKIYATSPSGSTNLCRTRCGALASSFRGIWRPRRSRVPPTRLIH